MLQNLDVNENEAFLAFKNGLKSWVRHKLKRGSVQELSKAMIVVESIVKLGLGKDKLEFFEFEERGICRGNHDEDNGDDNGKYAKEAKENNKSVEYFLYGGVHSLWSCLKKFAVEGDDGSNRTPMRLGSTVGRVKAKRAKRNKSITPLTRIHCQNTVSRHYQRL
ncbi:hypothetical protein Gotri_001264 [Gossypium trilobum]|uniref:Uncharacterized protein n=1 Tax=Gossypium trilobum TaxID=34281 RepID=A0A7J9FE56_9ROSI|nr:hypothetical protein [Gossypium trilobum]